MFEAEKEIYFRGPGGSKLTTQAQENTTKAEASSTKPNENPKSRSKRHSKGTQYKLCRVHLSPRRAQEGSRVVRDQLQRPDTCLNEPE